MIKTIKPQTNQNFDIRSLWYILQQNLDNTLISRSILFDISTIVASPDERLALPSLVGSVIQLSFGDRA